MSVGNVSKLTVEEHFSNFVGIYAATKTRKCGITSIVRSGHRTFRTILDNNLLFCLF